MLRKRVSWLKCNDIGIGNEFEVAVLRFVDKWRFVSGYENTTLVLVSADCDEEDDDKN